MSAGVEPHDVSVRPHDVSVRPHHVGISVADLAASVAWYERGAAAARAPRADERRADARH